MSFLTDSPHITRRMEGSKRREDPDSEVCDGLRQQVGDAGQTSAMMHLASGTQARPLDLTHQILKRRSRRSEGGQIVHIVQELPSVRKGQFWDNVKGGWLDPVLIREAREGEVAARKGARGVCKGLREPVLEGDGEEPHQDRLGGHEQGNVRVLEQKISMGREGIQHWTQARLVQRHITRE